MAFDGITIANITKELSETLLGGRIYKIAQPESDELLITVKNNGSQHRLLLSADASLPMVYLTENNKPSPMTAPGFCMLLRKHLQNARITAISQPGLERIIHLRLEHLNELGDLCEKKLIVEIMGKHSNTFPAWSAPCGKCCPAVPISSRRHRINGTPCGFPANIYSKTPPSSSNLRKTARL